jgi:hypothetical protein
LPELGFEGEAHVIGVRPAPVVEDGAGCVVTMTVQHVNNARVYVTLSSGEVIETTALHPFWSEDRGAWVQVQDLVEGEHVGGFSEPLTIIALEAQAAAELVHNIEVENDHTYFVGDSGALVHNTCGDEFVTLFHGSSSNRASKIVKRGFRENATFFAEDLSTAAHFAKYDAGALRQVGMAPKSFTVIEFKMRRSVYESLMMNRGPIGEDLGLAFTDIAGGTGFERILSASGVRSFNELMKSGAIATRRLRLP